MPLGIVAYICTYGRILCLFSKDLRLGKDSARKVLKLLENSRDENRARRIDESWNE